MQEMARPYSWLVVTLCFALLARIWVFVNMPPDLINGKDGFAYLNAARTLRGEKTSSYIDTVVPIPRNETMGRVVYPYFLNFVFSLSRWSPTPMRILERMKERQPRINDDWHWHFLTTKENLRAVQLLQHLLGILATAIAFFLLWQWTKAGWLATIGSLFAVGWRPAWLFFERCILTETLAATLLLITVALIVQAHRYRWSPVWMVGALVASYLLALTRPNFLFLFPLLVLYFAWHLPERYSSFIWLRRLVIVLAAFMVLIGVWKTYGAISAYHFALTPEAFEDPILRQALRERLANNPNDSHAIYHLIPTLMKRWNATWAETHSRLREETHKALKRRPDVFVNSTLKGLAEYFFYAGISWGSLRSLISLGIALFNVLGLATLFSRSAPLTLRLAVFVTVCNAFACAIVIGVNADQARYAFPTESLLSIAAFWILWNYLLVRWTRSKTSTLCEP